MTKIITLDPSQKKRPTSLLEMIMGRESKGNCTVTEINTGVAPPSDVQMILNFRVALATWADAAARNIGEPEVIIQLELLAKMMKMRRKAFQADAQDSGAVT